MIYLPPVGLKARTLNERGAVKLGGQLTSEGASPLAGSAVCFFLFFTSQQALWGSSPAKLSYRLSISLSVLLPYKSRKQWKEGGLIPLYTPPPFPFCHREVCLVNVPSESIGLRDGGVQAVAGCRSEPSILCTWEVAGAQGGIPPAYWINHRLVHSAAAVQLTKGDPVNAVRRYD